MAEWRAARLLCPSLIIPCLRMDLLPLGTPHRCFSTLQSAVPLFSSRSIHLSRLHRSHPPPRPCLLLLLHLDDRQWYLCCCRRVIHPFRMSRSRQHTDIPTHIFSSTIHESWDRLKWGMVELCHNPTARVLLIISSHFEIIIWGAHFEKRNGDRWDS